MRGGRFVSFFRIAALLAVLMVKLLWILLILEWSIRRARREFEKQILVYGVSREYARRMSATYRSVMRRSVRSMLKRSLGRSLWME